MHRVTEAFSKKEYEPLFVEVTEVAGKFTRPIHFVMRHYGSSELARGAATLFLVNTDGWAPTCGHVVGGTIFSTLRSKLLN